MVNNSLNNIHPGKVLRNEYILPKGHNVTTAAKLLGVTRQALNNIVNGKSGISSDMALLIASTLGGTPEMWQKLQRDYDLQIARKSRSKGSRNYSGSPWVNSSDISDWAATNDGHNYFPHVIRRLVRANAAVQKADFPSGDDVRKPGWDGLAFSSTEGTYLPQGWSGWEIGTESRPGAKAERDYLKREISPGYINPREVTYVAVTSKRWNDKLKWASNNAREGFWKDVKAYDATDIEQWLEIEQGVMVWLAERIGRRPPGVQSIEEFWKEFHRSTAPPISPELVLAGRLEQGKSLSNWLRQGTGALRILGDSSDEVLAFLAATVLTLQDLLKQQEDTVDAPASTDVDFLQDHLMARTILVSNSEQARLLIDSRDKFILAWCFEDTSLVGSAVANGHRVLVPLARDASATRAPNLELPRLGRREFAEALMLALPGNDEEKNKKADQIIRRTGRSLTVYRRLWSVAGASSTPEWARCDNARDLIPALLAGSWTERNEADKTILARLAGCDYTAFSRTLARWKARADPPLRLVDKVWLFGAPVDAWSLLAKYVVDSDLDLFREACLEVLGEDDPALELPLDERWLANVHGKEFKYSSVLRQGLADTLILLSEIGEGAGIPEASEISNQVVGNLLNQQSKVRWASASGLLRRLAEAAPEIFLRNIEDSLQQDPSCLMCLFEDGQNHFGGGSRHIALLWGLEVLAWFPDCFARATRILATLARHDPGGSYANRPSRSLYDIFCAWHPNTSVPMKKRLETLDNLLKDVGETGWELLLQLLPTGHATTSPTAEPRWRERPQRSESTHLDIYQTYEFLVSRALLDSSSNLERLVQLLPRVNTWSPAQRKQLFENLKQFAASCTNIEQRSLLCDEVRGSLALHRRHAEANWAMSEAELSVMEELWKSLEPQDLVERVRWLFDEEFVYLPWAPTLSRGNDDVGSMVFEAATERRTAIGAILDKHGIDGILTLAARVKEPRLIGIGLAETVTDAESENLVLEHSLAGDDDCVRKVGRAFVSQRFLKQLKQGVVWARSILESALFQTWESERQAEFCLGLPSPDAWKLICRLDESVQNLYWQQVSFFLGHGVTEQESEFAVEKLLQADRPLYALGHAGWHPEKLSSATLIRILDATRDKLAADIEVGKSTCFQHIEEVFGRLRSDPGLEAEELGKLEWTFMPWLRHQSGPKTLHRFLQRDPEFFAQVIKVVYRPENNSHASDTEAHECDPETQTRAEMAWRLLEDWMDWPGCGDDGTLDPESLRTWFAKARATCAASGHSKIGDDRIGRVLAYTPSDEDGVWPHTAIRELIEETKSSALDEGILVGRYHKKGLTVRSPFAGGSPERKLAVQYRDWSRRLKSRRIRTSRLLGDIAQMYESHGRREDIQAEYRDLVD